MTHSPGPSRPRVGMVLLGFVTDALLVSCAEVPTTPTQAPTEPVGSSRPVFAALTPSENAVTLVGAGDIAGCGASYHDEETASLVSSELGTTPGAIVFADGDEVYPSGTTANFQNCYAPTWGQQQIKARTLLPVAGNHEYGVAGATPYFDFFNGVGVDSGVAGKRGKGYYSFEASPYWHVVVLNSNSSVVPTVEGSTQEEWLKADLASPQASGKCVLALMHHPQFRSYNDSTETGTPYTPVWQDLYNAGADLVIVGHAHFYERFAPQTPRGLADNTFGVRQIIVGTGGGILATPQFSRANSEALSGTTFGVLRLTLDVGQYYWTFVPAGTATFTDEPTSGNPVPCHGAPPANVTPVAGFITQDGNYTCAALSCTFISNASAPAERSYDPDRPTNPPSEDGLVAWKWTFGDGKTSASQNTTTTYAKAGTYTVKLIVTDGRNDTASQSHRVTVSAAPATTAPTASFRRAAPY
jgi:PKD domain/Calcineurin-like phosphoesterase